LTCSVYPEKRAACQERKREQKHESSGNREEHTVILKLCTMSASGTKV
jgi:hypothetical protein